ncbi:MAG: DUF1566 domain-containing protein [Methylovulum sp.]|jgi:hypothetical protein|nr:DUF1566 domain-containing protein [Methylovulum sp.]
MSKLRTHYDNLKVARNAPDIVIKAAHKALLQLHHPDKASDKITAERITRILNDAREVLLDPIRRKQHDDWIIQQEKSQPHTHSSRHSDAHASSEPVTEQHIGKYRVASNGTVMDTETKLMWCRYPLGQRLTSTGVEGQAEIISWSEVLVCAEKFNQHGGCASFTNWRCPEISELKTLLQPTLNAATGLYLSAEIFPQSPALLWSATAYAGYGGGAWCVNFAEGLALNESPLFYCAVRLVREA